VKATEGERDELRARAAELGVSVPRLMVEAALDGGSLTATERRQEMVELFEVRRLLSTVANNINQLARQANATSEFPAEAREALKHLRSVAMRIDLTIEGLM
jgi:hypothetical protein